MSVFMSIGGCNPDMPKFYTDGYGGDEVDPSGWWDVATSCVAPRCRVILESRDEKEYASAYLDPDGVRELINMLQAALARMETDT